MISTAEANLELRTLWKEVIDNGTWPATLPKLWPLQYQPTIDTPTLVFVGVNPAYAQRDDRKCRERPIVASELLLDPNGRAKLCDDTQFASAPYFSPFDQFVAGTGLPHWAHLDVFAVRHTDQSAVKHALGLDGEWTEFAIRQYNIFRALLERIDPPVIVVPNAYASDKLHNALKAKETVDGCHLVNLNQREVPVFFAGMLTGQRAMDKYSRQRLVCQVRKMISNLGY